MAMTRRNFIETGIGAVAALSVTQGVSRAQSPTAHSGIIVVGVDGAGLTVPYLDDYLSVGATVWQYSETTIDFDRFASIYSFVEANSSKITLAKSYSDILAAKRARLPWSSAFKICGRLSGSGYGHGLQTQVLTIGPF
jgi:hypothetical protein